MESQQWATFIALSAEEQTDLALRAMNEAVVALGLDARYLDTHNAYVYADTVKDARGESQPEPSCLIGHVLARVGLSMQKLMLCTGDIGGVGVELGLHWQTILICAAAQGAQDNGATYQQAHEAALRVYSALGAIDAR